MRMDKKIYAPFIPHGILKKEKKVFTNTSMLKTKNK